MNGDYHISLAASTLDSTSSKCGPFVSILLAGNGGRVMGPVVNALGQTSSDLGCLRDLCAHMEYSRMTHRQAKALYLHQLNRKWGHNISHGPVGPASFSTAYGTTWLGARDHKEEVTTIARQMPTLMNHMHSLVSLTQYIQGRTKPAALSPLIY